MKVVYSWLKEYVDLSGIDPDELALRLTLAGMEVEAVERIGDWWDRERIVTAAVTWVGPHPNADRLVLADVDWGAGGVHRVVTGAPNLLAYRETGTLARPFKVAFAREGAELYDGHQDGWVKMVLKGRPVRGVMSDAMVCSAKELGLSDDHDGILILPEDTPVGQPLADVLGDAVFDVDILPNFARALNVVGVAREAAAILDRRFTPPPLAMAEDAALDPAGDYAGVVIEDPDLCPRYVARIIRDVTIGPSPDWMQRRLRLAGMRPINNVVDITNYVMLEWGEPLHAFDYDMLVERAGGGKPVITVRRAAPGERMTTLDGVERVLDGETLLITDGAGPVAIAGVMGGANTEVRPETRHILLEAASFNFLNVRRTSRQQKLQSESALRFGRGVHPAVAEAGSIAASELVRALGGGHVAPGAVDAYPRPAERVQVVLHPAEIRRYLGGEVPAGVCEDILRRLEFTVERDQTAKDAGTGDQAWRVTVPDHRMDIAIPADLVEEIARIYGYDRLPATLMADPLPPQRDNPALALEEAARDALAGADLQEIIGYRLWAIQHEARLDPEGRAADPSEYVVVINPISPERTYMRRSILTSLLDAAARNLRHAERVALFEVGRVYFPRPNRDELPDEPRRVGLVVTGHQEPRGWRVGAGSDLRRPLDFYDAKGAVEALLQAAGIAATWAPVTPASQHRSLHPGRSAAVYGAIGALGVSATSGASRAQGPQEPQGAQGSLGTSTIEVDNLVLLGHVGELHPLVREAWDLGELPVAVADLDLDAIAACMGQVRTFADFSAYPAVHRDLAVVVEESVPAAEVAAAIRAAGGAKLVEVALFDVYRGAQVGAGKKSLAWALTFQSMDETLTGEAVDKLRARIVRSLEARVGAEIR